MSTNPANAATGVAPTGPISATFTLPVDPAALSPTSTSLVTGDTFTSNSVSVTHAAAGAALNGTFLVPLALLSTYQWRLATSLRSTSGLFLPAQVVISFTVRDGVWSIASPVEASVENAQQPSVVMGPFGQDALIVFQQPNANGQRHPFAARFSAQTGLVSAPLDLVSGTNTILSPSVDATGSAAVVAWAEYSGGLDANIVARSYSFATNTWGPSVIVDPSVNTATFPRVAVDGVGNALLVYRQTQSPSSSVNDCWQSQYSASTAVWSAPQLLEAAAGDCSNVLPAIDVGGNLYVALVLGGDLFVTRKTSGSPTWTAPLSMESRPGPAALRDLRAASGVGIVWLLWVQEGNALATSYSSTSNTWDAVPFDLEGTNPTTPVSEAALAVTTSGQALVAFTQADPGGAFTRSAFLTHFLSGSSWSAPAELETLAGTVVDPQIATTFGGNSIITFSASQSLGGRLEGYRVRFRGSTATGSAPQLVQTSNLANVGSMRVAIDGSGRAVGVWESPDSIAANSIMLSRFE